MVEVNGLLEAAAALRTVVVKREKYCPSKKSNSLGLGHGNVSRRR
jgi:hypothetical protein